MIKAPDVLESKNLHSAVAFFFPTGLALKEFQQCLHLRHDAAHLASFRKQTILHDALMHFSEFLADVTEVAHHLFALGLRHGWGIVVALFYRIGRFCHPPQELYRSPNWALARPWKLTPNAFSTRFGELRRPDASASVGTWSYWEGWRIGDSNP